MTVVGDVRLENRAEVITSVGRRPGGCSDLELVAQTLERFGTDGVAKLIGDFSFVAWNARSREIVAARDALGVRALYYRRLSSRWLGISTRAAELTAGASYDEDFMYEFLVRGCGTSGHSVFCGVSALGPGEMLVQQSGGATTCEYWSPFTFAIDDSIDPASAIEGFRSLFLDAVRVALSGEKSVWAFLSGGLDSSSVVSAAALLGTRAGASRLLDGTVTFIDTSRSAYEGDYADAVRCEWKLRNEVISGGDFWADDGLAPPLTDEPSLSFPSFARDRRVCDVVRRAGGRVLLGGLGPDHYLTGGLQFLTDYWAHRQVRAAMVGLGTWSRVLGISAWRLGTEYLLRPLLPYPALLRRRRARMAPAWLMLQPTSWRTPRSETRQGRSDRRFPRYARAIAHAVRDVAADVDRGPVSDSLDVRYPFLYRPLVEFCLRLEPSMRTTPTGGKWILREAMRGILPEIVRTRIGKASLHECYVQSLRRQRACLDGMLTHSLLSEFGIVNGGKLRQAVDAARCGDRAKASEVLPALSLESWLAVRHRRWNRGS